MVAEKEVRDPLELEAKVKSLMNTPPMSPSHALILKAEARALRYALGEDLVLADKTVPGLPTSL